MGNRVILELSQDQALVLSDWITRFNSRDHNEFEDQAEEMVLWDIEAMLESKLVAPFESGYTELLEAARRRVRDTDGVTSN